MRRVLGLAGRWPWQWRGEACGPGGAVVRSAGALSCWHAQSPASMLRGGERQRRRKVVTFESGERGLGGGRRGGKDANGKDGEECRWCVPRVGLGVGHTRGVRRIQICFCWLHTII